jgi:VWFA-related protein
MTPRIVLGATVAALLATSWPSAQEPQRPVFAARRDAVRLDVSVTDRGKPITGLKPADFTILDNGVPQTVDYISFDELPLNVVLAFDVSGSMAGPRFDDLRNAGHAVVDQLKGEDRSAFVSFSHAVAVGSDLTGDRAAMHAAINWSAPSGQTSVVDGSFAGLTIGGSDTGRSLMLVFSDGLDTMSWLQPRAVLDAAKRANVVVFGVTAAKSRNPFLKDLVETTGGDVVEVKETSALRATFVKILAEYRQRYTLGYSPSGVTSGGWHKIQVTVPKRSATIKTRDGYQDK